MGSDGVGRAALKDLRNRFRGDTVVPGEPAYEDARAIYNSMIELRPAVIAQCADVHDVRTAIAFGREHDLEIAVRGGGHSVAGLALTDGGIVVDLRRLDAARVDPEARTVTVGGGATMSHLDRAAEPYGLATTGGRVSTTGVGGFTLGGGSGWFERKWGLACDNLVAAEVVTAAGELVRTDEEHHPDLFWALHGGGGNFGVVTSLTFRLHECPVVTAALLFWGPDSGPAVGRAYRDFFLTAPEELGGLLTYVTGADEEFVPEHLRGRLAMLAVVTCAGGEEAARRDMAPLLALGHEGEMIAEMSYADLQCMLDDPPGFRNYWSVEYLRSLPDEAVDRFCARAADMIVPSPSMHVLFPHGGAMARGNADFPVPWRAAPWAVHPFAAWEDPADDERGSRWARDVCADVREWATGDVYLNFIGDEGEQRLRSAYAPGQYERLAAVKATYDPDNVFRRNHNISPA